LHKKDFVLTPAMRACAKCGQRHLDRDCPSMQPCAVCRNRHLASDCPRIIIPDPGAPATSRHPATPDTDAAPAAAAAAVDTSRPATPGAAAPLPAADHTAVVVTAAEALRLSSASLKMKAAPSEVDQHIMQIASLKTQLQAAPTDAVDTACPATPGAAASLPAADPNAVAVTAAAGTTHPAAPSAAATYSDTDSPGAANVEAPPPGPHLLNQGPDTNAAPNAPLPAETAVERRNARVAQHFEEAIERRDAHVAQTYDAFSSDGSDNALHPRQRTTVHTAADIEWFTAARKERSVALFQIDALESRLHLARDHYQDLLRAVTDQEALIAERDARNDACWTPSPPAPPPASPRRSSHDPAHSFLIDLNDDLEIDYDISHGAPSPLPPTWSPLNRLYCSIWHISHKAWNKGMHALHGNGFDISDIFLLFIVAALSYRLTVIGIHLLTACQRATNVFIRPAVTAATTYSIIDAVTRLATPPPTSRAGPAFDTPPPPQETITDHHGRDKPAGHRPQRSGRGTSPPVASPPLLRPPRHW